MKSTFIRNSFVAPHNLAFSDKVLEASRKGAKGSEMSFEYEHGTPSGPTDVLANGNRRGYIAPVDNGILPELQEFVVTVSGRWTGRDDMGEAHAANVYAFVDNNPTNFVVSEFGLEQKSGLLGKWIITMNGKINCVLHGALL